MGIPNLTAKVSQTLRERVCNIKGMTVTSTPIEICGQDNNRSGVIIQNKDATNVLYLVFSNGGVVGQAMAVPPTGNISFDFSIGQSLYAFCSAGLDADIAVIEVTGFDTYQILMSKLVEICADRLDSCADLLALIASRQGVSSHDIKRALKRELT